jgi:hypothetical protein
MVLGVTSAQAIPQLYKVTLADRSTLSDVAILVVSNDSVGFSNHLSVHIDSITTISPSITITKVFGYIGATIGGIYGLIFRTSSKHFLDGVVDEPFIPYFGDVVVFSAMGGIIGYVIGWLLPSDNYHIDRLQHAEKVKLIKSLCK